MGPFLSQEGHFFLLDTEDQLGNVLHRPVLGQPPVPPTHAAKPMRLYHSLQISLNGIVIVGSAF